MALAAVLVIALEKHRETSKIHTRLPLTPVSQVRCPCCNWVKIRGTIPEMLMSRYSAKSVLHGNSDPAKLVWRRTSRGLPRILCMLMGVQRSTLEHRGLSYQMGNGLQKARPSARGHATEPPLYWFACANTMASAATRRSRHIVGLRVCQHHG